LLLLLLLLLLVFLQAASGDGSQGWPHAPGRP